MEVEADTDDAQPTVVKTEEQTVTQASSIDNTANSSTVAMDLPSANTTALNTESTSLSVILPPEEFAEDLDRRLGRANGNIYQRKPGIPNVHDGQIMVRLKKKRFIIIDYSIVPSAQDSATAALSPQILCPVGAGKQKCVTPECPKVGVPVMLFDSDPEQPISLYLRSGHCFLCQRITNEKRRTQRKRKSDIPQPGAPGSVPSGNSHHHQNGGGAAVDGNGNPLGYNSNNMDHKRFRLHGEILDLNPDAIIINGPLEGTKHHGAGYEYAEISADLQVIAQNTQAETARLAATVASLSSSSGSNEELANTTRDMLSTYEKAFLSMSKGIFLLSQWKSSWDSAVATATAEKAVVAVAAQQQHQQVPGTGMLEAHPEVTPAGTTPMLEAGAIADAVASAAAVAAAQQSSVGDDGAGVDVTNTHGEDGTVGGDSSSMIPLLLAANAKDEKKEGDNSGSLSNASAQEIIASANNPVEIDEDSNNTTAIFTV